MKLTKLANLIYGVLEESEEARTGAKASTAS